MNRESISSASADPQAAAKPSLKRRFVAWWEGYEFSREERKAGKNGKNGRGAAARAVIPPTIKSWPEPRRVLVQALFGEGMISPGSQASILRMIQPLGLNEKHTVVEIGAGLGGVARLIAKENKAYVFGYEADQDLVAAGTAISAKGGLAKKAQLRRMPAGSFEARPKSVDAFVAKESLFGVPSKSDMYAAIRKALKPGGQLTFTDFMLVGDRDAPAVQDWLAGEPVRPDLHSAVETKAELEALDLEVRVLEDISEDYRGEAVGAFAELAHAMRSSAETGEVDEERSSWLLSEGGLWSRRLAVLQSGEVKLFRLYARLPGVKELA